MGDIDDDEIHYYNDPESVNFGARIEIPPEISQITLDRLPAINKREVPIPDQFANFIAKFRVVFAAMVIFLGADCSARVNFERPLVDVVEDVVNSLIEEYSDNKSPQNR